jgi:hypothetical protein
MTSTQGQVDELAKTIWSKGGAILMYDAIRIAKIVLAAGYEKRPDHVAEADALRKQRQG